MATSSGPKWTEQEVDALVDFLFAERNKSGNGANFKTATYQAAAEHVAPFLQPGNEKSVKSVQNKWASLKVSHRQILDSSKSGVHWDNETGANIEGVAARQVWNEVIKDKYAGLKALERKG